MAWRPAAVLIAIATSRTPPTAILAAPVDAALAPAGAKCAAVPVLPQAAAPSRMAAAPPACRGLRGPSSCIASVCARYRLKA